MEALIIILAMVASAAFTVALITLNKYNSYHKLLNTMERAISDTQKKYEDTAKELEAARAAMQILTDNDNAHVIAITTLQGTVQQLSLTKLNNAPNRSFVPARNNGN